MRDLVLYALKKLPFFIGRRLTQIITSKRFRHRVLHDELHRLTAIASLSNRPPNLVALVKSAIALAREVEESDFRQAVAIRDQLSGLLRSNAFYSNHQFIQHLCDIAIITAKQAHGISQKADNRVAQLTARASKESFNLVKENLLNLASPIDLRAAFAQSEAGVDQALSLGRLDASGEIKTRLSYVVLLERLLTRSSNPTGEEHDFPLGLPNNCAHMQAAADALLAPWRDSLGYRLLVNRETTVSPSTSRRFLRAKPGRKILFISEENWFFLSNIINALENFPDVECRSFDFSIARALYNLEPREAGLPPLTGGSSTPELGEGYEMGLLKELIDWADVVFIEWCRWPAVWASVHLPESKHLIIRLHSFEAFSPMPHFMNWSNVNTLVFVADHIRQFFNVQLKERVRPEIQRVIDNFRDLAIFHPYGTPSRDFTLGMVGYSDANKNPRMAIQILKSLRDQDSRWTLNLIGAFWLDDAALSPTEQAYKSRFFSDIDAFCLKDAITFTGPVPWVEINQVMREIGIILSCSDREGTHEAIVEGIASGCVPLIRNWPTSAAYEGARTAFAGFEEFVFDSIEGAVSQAIAYGSPDQTLRHELAQRCVARFDQKANIGQILSLFSLTTGDTGGDESEELTASSAEAEDR